MIPIQETIAERPWAKLIKGNLVRDDVLGTTTQEEIEEALKVGAIVKRGNKSCVPMMSIPAKENAPGKAGERDYDAGDMIEVISTRYTDFIANREKRAVAKRYHDEAMMAALQGLSMPEPDTSQQSLIELNSIPFN